MGYSPRDRRESDMTEHTHTHTHTHHDQAICYKLGHTQTGTISAPGSLLLIPFLLLVSTLFTLFTYRKTSLPSLSQLTADNLSVNFLSIYCSYFDNWLIQLAHFLKSTH